MSPYILKTFYRNEVEASRQCQRHFAVVHDLVCFVELQAPLLARWVRYYRYTACGVTASALALVHGRSRFPL